MSLAAALASLPAMSGVYEFFSSDNRLLYVGKAKNLKSRVRSYFDLRALRGAGVAGSREAGETGGGGATLAPNPRNGPRIQMMISQTTRLTFITTPSEADALVLENSLIKQLRPKYNILLRDDKTYPYIYIDLAEAYPRPRSTRRLIKGGRVKYFGPFFRGARELLDALYLYYPLRQRASCREACLFHQISRCQAPCEGKITPEDYAAILAQAMRALNRPAILIAKLEEQMQKLAQGENYEEAAKVRDQIATLRALETRVQIDLARDEDFEVFALAFDPGEGGAGRICATRFVIRSGRVSSVKSVLASAASYDKDEAYRQVILENFATDTPLVSGMIYSFEDFADAGLLSQLLSSRFGKSVRIKSPKIGEKRRICELAQQNALIQLGRREEDLVARIQKIFRLENTPRVIEIFDNSQLQGRVCVGAMVRWEADVAGSSEEGRAGGGAGGSRAARAVGGGRWAREGYRKFHLAATNEYEQMRELLTRRSGRFDEVPPPDLWLIDGGGALLDLARDLIQKSGANIDVMAISKEKTDPKTGHSTRGPRTRRARGSALDKLHAAGGSLTLAANDEVLLFFQRLRDEAHRFALSFHRAARLKKDLASSKLAALNISPGRVKKLLDFYENFEAIHAAPQAELASLVGAELAEKIKKGQK